ARPRSTLECESPAAQSAPVRRSVAGRGGEHVLDLDGLLPAAVAIQLDAAILSARRRAGAQLDRNRPPHFQPELHRGGLPSGGRPLRGRGKGDARSEERRVGKEGGGWGAQSAERERCERERIGASGY